MQVRSLHVENFKNYLNVRYTPVAGVNCLWGRNGSGKTNLLDSIYYLCTGKSFLNPQDAQLIADEAPYFSIRGQIEINSGKDEVACVLVRGRRKVIKRNGVAYKRLVEHYGKYPIVVIAPGDIELIQGGSEIRRKWLDSILSMYDHNYLENLLRYDKLLVQRNAQLKAMGEMSRPNRALLEVYDELILPVATAIHEARVGFMKGFLPVFLQYHQSLTEKPEEVGLEYKSTMNEEPLAESLERGWKKDVILQRTRYGPHRDDLAFTLRGEAMKRFGSQGQQKTYLLALKLAQYAFLHEQTGHLPVLLLDDICERLDEYRLNRLFSLLSGPNLGQTFITDTSRERLEAHLAGIDAEVQYTLVENGELK